MYERVANFLTHIAQLYGIVMTFDGCKLWIVIEDAILDSGLFFV